ncbi:hypothetical protein DFA_11161 [Cavenderia fasciculata]|uniref:Protein kinase domain-containing protein n=1 Tax=Cavenderia fasciculata TaxID=261658 RepID=F4QF93_CACFS|nr:uncharacterized protein DFA_11161 [Cavenderia fasciculata]EGG13400.1 hypothetical protein DFA_11161 [Cavenderia fasciculata]|eukprot:XP_004350104.1 hypothetical protein DFA_11161 [Cavenderia fasciculata]
MVIKKATLQNQDKDKYIKRELEFYKLIENKSFFLLRCLNIQNKEDNIIRLPYMQLDTLDDVLTKNKYLYVDTIINMVRNIIGGIKELHQLKISHCDLKPRNIFVDDQYNIKIGDFDSARTTMAGKDIVRYIPSSWPSKYKNLLRKCLTPPYPTIAEVSALWEDIPYSDHWEMYYTSGKYNTMLFNKAKNLRNLPIKQYKFPSLGANIIKMIETAFNKNQLVKLIGIPGTGKTIIAYMYSLTVDNFHNRTPIWVNSKKNLDDKLKDIANQGKSCSFLIVWDDFEGKKSEGDIKFDMPDKTIDVKFLITSKINVDSFGEHVHFPGDSDHIDLNQNQTFDSKKLLEEIVDNLKAKETPKTKVGEPLVDAEEREMALKEIEKSIQEIPKFPSLLDHLTGSQVNSSEWIQETIE